MTSAPRHFLKPSGHAPTLVSVEMGYGHLRAALPLADVLGTPLLHADRPPLADPLEQRPWERVRRFYDNVSRLSQRPLIGRIFDPFLDAITSIPRLHPFRDLSQSTMGTRSLERLIRKGLGKGLVAHLKATGSALLTTFYAPAIAADALGCQDIYCVVTDSDINRIWAPLKPMESRIHYFVPSRRAGRRLQAYGVPPDQVQFTGFPLPPELLGGPDLLHLRRNLAARLVRLDPTGAFRNFASVELDRALGSLPPDQLGRPPLLVFAVGGSGAQVDLAGRLIPSLKRSILNRKIRLALVAGVRPEVGRRLALQVERNGLAGELGSAIQLLSEPDLATYFRRFNELLAQTDILWTKPSELTFFAALGIPLILSSPVGVHEWSNRRWAREHGAGLKQRDARFAAGWIEEWLLDGILAGVAWAGFTRLPKLGVYEIAKAFSGDLTPPKAPAGDAAADREPAQLRH